MPEDRLAPRVQVNLDELEEDLDDYGEYIRVEHQHQFSILIYHLSISISFLSLFTILATATVFYPSLPS